MGLGVKNLSCKFSLYWGYIWQWNGAKRRKCQCIRNICNILLQKWGAGGQGPFKAFPKIHLFWHQKASLITPFLPDCCPNSNKYWNQIQIRLCTRPWQNESNKNIVKENLSIIDVPIFRLCHSNTCALGFLYLPGLPKDFWLLLCVFHIGCLLFIFMIAFWENSNISWNRCI